MLLEAALRVMEKVLDIVLEAMKGQTPAQKAILWERHIQSLDFWTKVFRLDDLRDRVMKEDPK